MEPALHDGAPRQSCRHDAKHYDVQLVRCHILGADCFEGQNIRREVHGANANELNINSLLATHENGSADDLIEYKFE